MNVDPFPAPPNIVIVMSDEHDPGVTGCYGDTIVETPNIDRLAREGVTFDACYTTSPLCAPARLSFTACQYISRIGGWSNDCSLRPDSGSTIARVLQGAGYETFLCGKQHYERDLRYGFTDILPEASSNKGSPHGRGERRHPNDFSQSVDGGEGWQSRCAQFHPGDDSRILRHDRLVTARACDFLGNRRSGDCPFLLFVGHLAPHFPLIAPEEIYRKYQGRVPMPDIPEGLIANLPTNYRHLRHGFGLENIDPAVVRLGRELYWALVDWYDGQVGEVMEALRQSAVTENTVVIYTSDHGENKGDHGLWWKNNMYEHAARIPLVMSCPDRWAGGQRRAGACSLVDLVQTLAHLGGADRPESWDGDSMLPWLDDGNVPWKDEAVSEYYGHNIVSGITMYRSGSWKYIYHARGDERSEPERELFDLETDPKEFCNLANDPKQAERLAAMHESLVRELGYEPDEAEIRCRRDYARGYGP